jgi:hypothetical protein
MNLECERGLGKPLQTHRLLFEGMSLVMRIRLALSALVVATAQDSLQASFALPDSTIDTAAFPILCALLRFRFS